MGSFKRTIAVIEFLTLFLCMGMALCGQVLMGGDLHLRRLNARAVLVSGGPQNINIAAFQTGKGIVLVDTGASETEGKEARSLVESAFPGHGFTYVINTHSHWDHISGNSVFPEAEIVAHRNCRDLIEKKGEGPGMMPGAETAAESPSEDLANEAEADLPPPPPPAGTIWFEGERYGLTIPDITFEDSMSLYCGDTTFNLYYFGKAHTISDILIVVPEANILLTGDLFFNNWLPVFSPWVDPDIERWAEVREIVLAGNQEYGTVIPGHGPLMKTDDLARQFDYRIKLWEFAERELDSGNSLDMAMKVLSIEKQFPDLVDANIKDSRGRTVHDENIKAIFEILGKRSTR